MLAKVARNTFNDAVVDVQRRKALAFAIFMKEKNTTSVFKDYSLRSLAKYAGLSTGTVKKRLETLLAMKLVRYEERNGHTYLVFKKLRRRKIRNKKNELFHTPTRLDVSIEKANKVSVGAIEKYLFALHIQEHTRKVEYVKRLIKLGTDPAPFSRNKEIKKAKAIWRKRGCDKIPTYKEYGYSYRRIQKRLHCGPQTVKNAIALGESLEMFVAHREEFVLVKYIGGYAARFALEYFKDEYPTAFATSNNIYFRPVTTFSLMEEVRL